MQPDDFQFRTGDFQSPGTAISSHKNIQVADILGLSISGVYNLIQRGGLPTLKIGKSYRVKLPDLEKWMNAATYMSDYDKAKLIAQEKIKIKRN